MAREFDYAATHQDEVSMLRDVLASEDATAFVSDWYRTREPVSFRHVSKEVEILLRRRWMLFLWSPRFSRHKVVLDRVGDDDSDEAPVYTIDRSVGPLIVWSLSSGTDPIDGVDTVAFGSIYYQPRYCDPATGAFSRVPGELVDCYGRMVNIVKKYVKRTKYNGKSVYIGLDALARLGAGSLRLRGGEEPE
jgi:hypothetical protein